MFNTTSIEPKKINCNMFQYFPDSVYGKKIFSNNIFVSICNIYKDSLIYNTIIILIDFIITKNNNRNAVYVIHTLKL